MDFSQYEKVVHSGLVHIIDNERPLKDVFNKKAYEAEFMKLYQLYQQAMTAYNYLYEQNTNPEAYAREIAGKLIRQEEGHLDAVSGKNKRKMRLMDDTAYVALFVIPAFDYYHTKATDDLADALVDEWRNHFPEHQIKRGQFETINQGFKKRKFCYITTAVCMSMNKPDNCYELETLRDFRDNWLENQPDGRELVENYYTLAPAIIAKIETSPCCFEIYKNIYSQWLKPCICLIEENKYDKCLVTYKHMVNWLDGGHWAC